MTEAERIAVRLVFYDGVPCWCEKCTQRRLNMMDLSKLTADQQRAIAEIALAAGGALR